MKKLYLWMVGGIALLAVIWLAVGLRQWLPGKVVTPKIGAVYTVVASAYAPSPHQTDGTPCVTASGTRVREGVAASNFLPIGTIFSIKDDLYIVEDRMNSRYQAGYVDLWFPSTEEALDFGRRKIKIKIEDYGTPGQSLVKGDSQRVIKPGTIERMNLRFLASTNALTRSLRAAVSGKSDVNCDETQ